MIFLTVGTQLPFDRLVRAVDQWCADQGRDDVFGQIGNPGENGYRPRHFPFAEFLEPTEFAERFAQSSLIVAHAGMGSIITALANSKPIVIFPRFAALKEHRNDHQVATAERFASKNGVFAAATDEDELGKQIDIALQTKSGGSLARDVADSALIDTLRTFILRNDKSRPLVDTELASEGTGGNN